MTRRQGSGAQRRAAEAAAVRVPVDSETVDWIPPPDLVPAHRCDGREFPAGFLFAERYRIGGVLGSGISGTVYRAWDQVLGTRVALKVLSSGASARLLERFRREVALAQKLRHAGVVRVHDIGITARYTYLSMELMAGGCLADLLRRGPLPIEEASRLLRDVAEALGHLHDRGILHRDVKPANILLEAAGGRARLGDLGLARLRDEDTELTVGIVGTPRYMAPELLVGGTATVPSDLYSLGATFYEALTGHQPRAPAGAVTRPSPVRRLRPDVPRPLARVVERCLDPRPRDRFASAAELLTALDERPRLGATARRTWRLAALVSATALLVLAGRAFDPRPGAAVAVELGGAGLVGVDGAGRPLWEKPVSRDDLRVKPSPRGDGKSFFIVEGKDGGESVTLLDASGETVWETHAAGREVTASWMSGPAYEGFMMVAEQERSRAMPRRSYTGRLLLVDRDGTVVLDTAESARSIDGYHPDPLGEFSGALEPRVFTWSRGLAPPPSSARRFAVGMTNVPWYYTCFEVLGTRGRLEQMFCNPGRILSVAHLEVPGRAPRIGLVLGNSELLHVSAFALLPADGALLAWAPPRMSDQNHRENRLISYTLLPVDQNEFGQQTHAIRLTSDGFIELCGRSGDCLTLDWEGHLVEEAGRRSGSAAALREERMRWFRRLSTLDELRRAGDFDYAEELYRELKEDSEGLSEIRAAALFWIGARTAVARGDLPEVVRRTGEVERRWSRTADACLLRAEARILAGAYAGARRDLSRTEAEHQLTSTYDAVVLLRFASSWLQGRHLEARDWVDKITFGPERVRLEAFVRLFADDDPRGTLELLDPWVDDIVTEGLQLLRALALVELGRTVEARQALVAERERHGWLHRECAWVELAADLAEGRGVVPEAALELFAWAQKGSRTDLETRLLLPRIRLTAARVLHRAGRRSEAVEILEELLAEHPPPALAAAARAALQRTAG